MAGVIGVMGRITADAMATTEPLSTVSETRFVSRRVTFSAKSLVKPDTVADRKKTEKKYST